jgi:two-component system chemotaxis response regulator CheB
MIPLRVLVVDDSVVVRRLVTEALAAEPDLEVVGTASNGRLALAKLGALKPDAVILDVEMPEMDGLATIPHLRDQRPDMPIVMFSTLTERGAAVTLEALHLGASDWLHKPSNLGDERERQAIGPVLAEKLRALCRRPPVETLPPLRVHPANGDTSRVDLVVVGVSTGGPKALATLVAGLPASLAAPVLVVQHMPPVFTRQLAGRLHAIGTLEATEARPGLVVRPGQLCVAPGDRHLVVRRATADGVEVDLDDGPPQHSCKPAVDPMFTSAAAAFASHVLGVVLTGMGNDGAIGAAHLVDAGSRVVVQDEATSVVWGMPGAVARAGLAEAILPLEEMAGEITRRAAVGRRPTPPTPLASLALAAGVRS